MTKSYRLRTKVGVDQNIRININQDFDFLEILSLKLRQEDVYTRFCSDYGVVVGRVVANGGFGIPNANISIFVPLSSIDENDPVISTLYPYKNLDQKNEDGYRYNLLPYEREYNGHTPTGTFPSREDVLTRKEVLEIYEKYYKYTVKTNDSGDFMVVGVPLGNQKIVVDLDLSNMGCFSLRPTDLIRMGRGTAEQFDGQRFKSSSDLASLPQLFNTAKDIDVTPFWGEEDICNIGITRVDFDLRDFNIDIKPQATFMGSIFSSSEEDFLRTNCKPKNDVGNLCDLVTGPGRILAIRQTKDYDVNGRPILEEYNLENGGNVIDDDGAWLVEVPMNLDYVITNEFGDQVLSADPSVGIPTKGRYRFRIKYQNESGLNAPIQRADYLVPNIKEWGWTASTENSSTAPPLDTVTQLKNYAFSLDWNDYGDTGTTIGLAMIQEAINCEDRFYEFNYNKVYTVSSFIDRWKWGFGRGRHLGIKEITDRTCVNSTNKFPVNDGVRNFDFIFFLFNLFISISAFIIYPLLVLMHVLAFLYPILRIIVNIVIWLINVIIYSICIVVASLSSKLKKEDCKKSTIKPLSEDNPFKRLSFPMISYPDCEACPCESSDLTADGGDFAQQANDTISAVNTSLLGDVNSVASYNRDFHAGTGLSQDIKDSYNTATNQLFSGYQLQGNSNRDKLVKLPIIEIPEQSANSDLYIGADVTLAQSLNLMNQRGRYFDPVGPNRIKTTVKNTNPSTNAIELSQPFEDNILIILCDPGTLSNLTPGQILTFNNPQGINDPNTSGLTTTNQFNTNAITGSTPYNATQLVTKQISSLDPTWSVTQKTLKLKISENGKQYKFKAGTEYFQVITGDTYANYFNITSTSETNTPIGPRWNSILNEYMFKKIQSITYEYFDFAVPLPGTRLNVYSTDFLQGKDDYEIIFLTRGVDPYTEKQKIEFDLSKIFGYNYGSGPTIEGDYYMNIPIQDNTGTGPWHNDTLTPESHDIINNTNTKLYHEPYGFNVDLSLFSAFTNNSPHYYNSTDKSRVNIKAYNTDPNPINLGFFTNNGVSAKNDKLAFQVHYIPPAGSGYDLSQYKQQGLIEGASVQATTFTPSLINPLNLDDFPTLFARTFSPAYHLESPQNITITANNRLVFRSDRLPTSDITEVRGNSSFSLHLNDNFGFYLVDENGIGTITPGLTVSATDSTGNGQNFAEDGGQFANVVGSLSCEQMVPLKCYEGTGVNFVVNPDCDENKMGKDNENKRVVGGCYYFVDNPLIISLPKDIKAFEEWKSRFRFNFAACRGVISHVFQNNWVNGTLYMFSFKNAKRFTILGDLKRYKYCGDPLSFRPSQGPLIFTFGTTNSFFYRATPYNYQTNEFIGQLPKKIDASPLLNNVWESADNYGGMNTKNIFFPTTVMDLGPRDEFTKEICFNPQFEGYLVDTLRSTSFNDGGDVLQLFILSRLINSNFWGQALSLGDASINRIFSRSEDRIDGDFAQTISINSEYGVEGFSSDDYDQNDIYIENSGGDPLFGIFFSSDTSNRQLLSPGKTSYTTFGYPKTQKVPLYKWKSESQTTIFGSDKNNWVTDGPFYSQPYQSMDFTQTDYFKPGNGEKLGYIYSRTPSLSLTPSWPNGQSTSYVVGAPHHFYFGLGKGKSAMNKYITKYIFNQ